MITAAQVKELRESTGVGMMECKKALEECDGDLKRALTLLREKGLSKAAKKSGRVAAEGMVEFIVSSDHKEAAIVELNCETDFAGKNQSFRDMAKQLAELAMARKISSVDAMKKEKLGSKGAVEDELVQLVSTIGENINLRRVEYVNVPNGFIAGYNHMQGKIGALVVMEGTRDAKTAELASDVAMHIAASAPRYMERSQISAAELEEEKNVLRKQLAESGKPAAVAEKILEGQVNKFYAEACLLDQPFVKEPKLSVSQHIKNTANGLKAVRFIRFQLGEGIETTKGNFQQEVAELVK